MRQLIPNYGSITGEAVTVVFWMSLQMENIDEVPRIDKRTKVARKNTLEKM